VIALWRASGETIERVAKLAEEAELRADARLAVECGDGAGSGEGAEESEAGGVEQVEERVEQQQAQRRDDSSSSQASSSHHHATKPYHHHQQQPVHTTTTTSRNSSSSSSSSRPDAPQQQQQQKQPPGRQRKRWVPHSGDPVINVEAYPLAPAGLGLNGSDLYSAEHLMGHTRAAVALLELAEESKGWRQVSHGALQLWHQHDMERGLQLFRAHCVLDETMLVGWGWGWGWGVGGLGGLRCAVAIQVVGCSSSSSRAQQNGAAAAAAAERSRTEQHHKKTGS